MSARDTCVAPAPVYACGVKKRLDVRVAELGLAETRSRAQALVMAGRRRRVSTRRERRCDENGRVEVERTPRYVSRGGEKLVTALERRHRSARVACLDVGASTGGFTDCLLQPGAAHVIAVDVGRGQIHERLRATIRVTVLEGVNARIGPGLCPPAGLVDGRRLVHLAADVLPPLVVGSPGRAATLVLVKPQFEAGRDDAPKGVVREPESTRRAARCRRGARPAGRRGRSACEILPSPAPPATASPAGARRTIRSRRPSRMARPAALRDAVG